MSSSHDSNILKSETSADNLPSEQVSISTSATGEASSNLPSSPSATSTNNTAVSSIPLAPADSRLVPFVTFLKSDLDLSRVQTDEFRSSFINLVEIAVRGREPAARAVVDAGVLDIITPILRLCLETLESLAALGIPITRKAYRTETTRAAEATATAIAVTGEELKADQSGVDEESTVLPEAKRQRREFEPTAENGVQSLVSGSTQVESIPVTEACSCTSASTQPSTSPLAMAATSVPGQDQPDELVGQFFPFHEDQILYAIRLLAYMSKHPLVRATIQLQDPTLWEAIQKFTDATIHPEAIIYWATVILRNVSRPNLQDLRRCARIGCDKTESKPVEFLKCPICRVSSYCSKDCYRQGKKEGHFQWCIRKESKSSESTTMAPNEQETAEKEDKDKDVATAESAASNSPAKESTTTAVSSDRDDDGNNAVVGADGDTVVMIAAAIEE